MNNTKDLLVTPRLVLRHFNYNDASEMFLNWASDIEVTKYVTWDPHQSVEETKTIINMWMKEYEDSNTHRFAITLKSSGELIGGIDVVEYEDGHPVIGYVLSRKYWNQGYMTEACKEFVDYLLSLGYKTLVIEAVDQNIGSNRVISKCGFSYIGSDIRENKNELVTVYRYQLNRGK